MPLEPGAKLGPYQILSAETGSGSEVYKASDTRDSRQVSIRLSAGPISERLEQDAQVVASLQHPHICALHDIGHEEGVDFLVTECLEGQTLAGRLEKGALDLRQAVTTAIQIADALDQAHRLGVLHRSLDPSKVVLTSSGAKLVGFGLAEPVPVPPPSSAAKTPPPPGADAGLPYTAPECLEGKEPDARSDIFAFGAVLYEMITGSKAFEGKSRAVLLAAIATVDPDPLSKTQPHAPPLLQHIVDRCLAKDPENRWQTVHDLLVQLRWMTEGGQVPASAARARERLTWALVAAAALLILALSVPAAMYLRGPGDPAPFQFRVPVRGLSTSDIALSPDGQAIAMVARPNTGEAASLYVRRVGSVAFQRLGGTEDATQPFWSADSRYIGFVAGGRLKQVSAAGGAPKDIAEAQGFTGGAWNRDGAILFGSPKGIYRVSAEGGKPALVTAVDPQDSGHFWPGFLPDGRHFLYLAWSGQAANRAVFLASLDSKDKTKLMAAESNTLYAAPGYVVFHRDASLFAQPFDARKLALGGEPVHIADQVSSSPANGRGDFDVSQTGSLLYYQGTSAPAGRARILNSGVQWGWADRAGSPTDHSYAGEPGPYGDFDLSPDGKLIAVTKQDTGPGADIWVIDWQRAGVTDRVTLDPADDIGPVWAPDGKHIAFTTYRKGNADIYVAEHGSGVGKETPLLETTVDEIVKDWSKDGRYIAYLTGEGNFLDIYALPLVDGKPDPARKPFPVVQGHFQKSEPQFSYDGKWLAYTSDRTVPGTFQVYVRSFPEGDQEIAVSTAGGGQPRWRKDGKELYYRSPDENIMAVDIKPGARLEAGIPHALFLAPFRNAATHDPVRHLLSVTPDGQRFLLRVPPGGSGIIGNTTVPEVPILATGGSSPAATGGRGSGAGAVTGLTVIQHWTSAVKKEGQ
jgi:Tol biopolymer transport system component